MACVEACLLFPQRDHPADGDLDLLPASALNVRPADAPWEYEVTDDLVVPYDERHGAWGMPRRVKYSDAEPNDIERLAVYERLVVSDLPFGIRGVHVDRSACLSAYRLQRIHVVGVAMRY
jgi:hypothetical protein